jgi:hypothetical protein
VPNIPTIGYATGTTNPQAGAVPSTSFCQNRTFTLIGNPTGGNWSSTNSSVVTVNIGGIANTVGTGIGSVVYTITVNGCSSGKSVVGNVVACAARGVVDNGQLIMDNGFAFYPNPVRSIISLYLKTLVGAGSIVVTDLYGKQVKLQALSMGANTVDVSNLLKGIYFVSVITSEGKNTKKLVVE